VLTKLHPFLSLDVSSLRFWVAASVVAFVATTAVFVAAIPVNHIAAAAHLLAASSADAQAILGQWGSDQRASFQFMLGYDFLYDLVHNNMVALLVVWGAVRVGRSWSMALAGLIAWVLWADSALNVFENLAYVRVLATNNVEPWHPYASAVFNFRTVTLNLGGIAAVGLHAYASVNRRLNRQE